jgi:hypothetical protein
MIGYVRHRQCIRLIPFQPLFRLDLLPDSGLPANHERAQVQLQFAVNPVDTLMPPQACKHALPGNNSNQNLSHSADTTSRSLPYNNLPVSEKHRPKPQVRRLGVNFTSHSAISAFSSHSLRSYGRHVLLRHNARAQSSRLLECPYLNVQPGLSLPLGGGLPLGNLYDCTTHWSCPGLVPVSLEQ